MQMSLFSCQTDYPPLFFSLSLHVSFCISVSAILSQSLCLSVSVSPSFCLGLSVFLSPFLCLSVAVSLSLRLPVFLPRSLCLFDSQSGWL